MKSKFKYVFLLLVSCLCISGCVSIQPISPITTNFDAPRLNTLTEKELGDTLVDKGVMRTFDALAISEELIASYGLVTYRAAPGVYSAMGRTSFGILYRSHKPIIGAGPFGSCSADGGIILPNDSSKPATLYFYNQGQFITSTPLKKFTSKKTTSEEILPGSYRQELIFNGRVGSALKFLYREFNEQYIRAPFTQEIAYDLKDGDVIGFKGARIQVIEATNVKIQYKVLKSFE